MVPLTGTLLLLDKTNYREPGVFCKSNCYAFDTCMDSLSLYSLGATITLRMMSVKYSKSS